MDSVRVPPFLLFNLSYPTFVYQGGLIQDVFNNRIDEFPYNSYAWKRVNNPDARLFFGDSMFLTLCIVSFTSQAYRPLTPAFKRYLIERGFELNHGWYRLGPKAKFVSRSEFRFQSISSAADEWNIHIFTVPVDKPNRNSFLTTNLAFFPSAVAIPGATYVEEPRTPGADQTIRVITDYSQITMTRSPRYSLGPRGLKPPSYPNPAALRSELIAAMKKFVAEYRPIIQAIMKEGGTRSSKFNRGK